VGNGNITDQHSPVKAIGVTDAAEIAMGGYGNNAATYSVHTCVKTTDGRMQCWGDNNYGQLGNGTINDVYTPQYVKTINEAGDQPLAGSGLWTANGSDIYYTSGNVGINTTTPNYELDINGTTQTNILQLADSGANSNLWTLREQVDNNFAISLNGTQTLTLTESGSLGLGTTNPTHKLSVVGGDIYTSGNILASNITTQCPIGEALRGFDANGDPVCITVGAAGGETTINQVEKLWEGQYTDYSTCVVMEDKKVQCWGRDDGGELGTGTLTSNQLLPQVVNLPGDVDSVISVKNANYAILENGELYAWGYNAHGQLGDGTTTVRHSPVRVGTLTNIEKVVTSKPEMQDAFSTCAIDTSGNVSCWGYNGYGQLGVGDNTQRNAPTQVVGITTAIDISAGGGNRATTAVILQDGTTRIWGHNNEGQLVIFL
jgi:alpha-tubulin suppressor-like RCC1 family protein